MRKLFIIISFLSFIFGCSTDRPQGKTEAEVLFKEANDLIKDERYLLSIEKLNAIRSQYPYSYYATHAELLNADVLFLQENYSEAAAAYIVFKDFHPKHKKVAYVIWKIAEAFYNQLPDTEDRDLTPGHEAIKYYKELLRVFKGSKFTDKAADKVKKCENMIEDKETYIADFYFKTEVFDSARHRYRSIVGNYTVNKRTRDHAMVRAVMSSYELKDKISCKQDYNKYKGLVASSYKTQLDEAYGECIN